MSQINQITGQIRDKILADKNADTEIRCGAILKCRLCPICDKPLTKGQDSTTIYIDHFTKSAHRKCKDKMKGAPYDPVDW